MANHSLARPRPLVSGALLVTLLAVTGCGRSAAVQTTSSLPLRRVVVYRNGVGYFERQGHVSEGEVRFRVTQGEVDDFLATLAVMERGGSSVRSAAFPLPEEHPASDAPPADARRTVRLSLDGREHDLLVGYTVETPIWRPSYRLVFSEGTAQVQAWGIVQNVSGEDWSDVNLSLVAGAPVSFRSQLSRPTVPLRPTVTDQGAVIDAVPQSDTTLAQEQPGDAPAPEPSPQPSEDASGYGGLGLRGSGVGGGGAGEGTIGLGNIGTMGRGAGTGSGQGYGSGGGRGLSERRAAGPRVRAAPPTVSGSLSPEAIRRVVLRNLGQVSHCHEQSLASNPGASGRVIVRFLIGPTGAVQGSSVAASSYPNASAAQCIASAVRRWQFPSPEGGGVVSVNYPFNLLSSEGDLDDTRSETAAAATSAPRNVSALAALAVQGGVTRYDLPQRVTIPDRSATMVMLTAREVPGSQMYLFAPDPGVPDSSAHPFHVARFENRTGALLERGPIAIFEAGAYLGQGLLEPLPDAATTTIPFALERGLAVDHSATAAVEGARLLTMLRGELTIERFNVQRTTYRVRNGVERPVRLMLRHALHGAQIFEPPAGTEQSGGNALVPVEVAARARGEVIVTTRSAFTDHAELSDEQAATAIEQYLRDGHPAADVALALRTALDLRRQLDTLTRERADVEQRRDDLQTSVAETRQNLLAIQRNAQAADLRAQLTARLGRGATQLDQLTRRIVELDTQMGERRVRLVETVRGIDVDVSRATPPAAAATP